MRRGWLGETCLDRRKPRTGSQSHRFTQRTEEGRLSHDFLEPNPQPVMNFQTDGPHPRARKEALEIADVSSRLQELALLLGPNPSEFRPKACGG